VRRAIAFAELLQHPNLVRMMGTWESDDIIFVGECDASGTLVPLTGRANSSSWHLVRKGRACHMQVRSGCRFQALLKHGLALCLQRACSAA
jgi:hypothetical protein